jgi:hypothetical protein
MTGTHRIVYRARDDATPEGELNALGAVYKFILFDSQIRGGGSHDLTRNPITETPKNRSRENRTGET